MPPIDRAARRLKKKEERLKKRAMRKPSVLLQEFWNLPNMLTVARMAAIPLFVWFTYDADPAASMWATLIFAAACITDVVDGYLARRWNLVTVVGKFMDPLADKLIVMAALVMMVRLGRIGAWVVITLLAREFIVTGLRQIAASEGMVISAGQEGKWKTSLQVVGIVGLLIHYRHPLDLYFWQLWVDWNQVGIALMLLSMILSVWSMAVYFKAFLGMLAKRDPTT